MLRCIGSLHLADAADKADLHALGGTLERQLVAKSRLPRPEFEVRFAPNSRHSEAPAGLPLVTHSGSRGSPFRDTLYRRLQPFRHLHDCSGCFRLERSPGGTCTHWKCAALARRTPTAVISITQISMADDTSVRHMQFGEIRIFVREIQFYSGC